MPNKLADSPLFILGLPRSGTSMIAGALKKSGAWAGSTIAATAANPKGFFEHAQIRENVVKKTLVHLGCDPLGVSRLPTLDAQFPGRSLRNTILKIIQSDGYRGNRQWLYKDAKLALLWPMFSSAFPDARWIYVKRDIESFIDSCLRTPFMYQHSSRRDYWEQFADEYIARIQALKDSGANFFELESPAIVAGNFASLQNLIEQAGLQYDEKKMRKFIDPEHWHGATS